MNQLRIRDEGAGEPVILFHTGFVVDGLAPLFGEPALARHRLVAYHRRGYRVALERALPGAFDAAVRDAGAMFAGEMPALQAWPRGPGDRREIEVPALSILGAGSDWPGFRETHEALLGWLPRCESLVLPGVGHLLQIAAPAAVAEGLGAFLARTAAPAP